MCDIGKNWKAVRMRDSLWLGGIWDQPLPWKTQYWEDKRLGLLWQSGFKIVPFLLMKGRGESCKTRNWIINLRRKNRAWKKRWEITRSLFFEHCWSESTSHPLHTQCSLPLTPIMLKPHISWGYAWDVWKGHEPLALHYCWNFILVLFFRALRERGSLFVLNLSLHWADCWDNLQPELSELMWPGSICVQTCFAFSSIYFYCKPCRAGCSCYTYTKSVPRDSVPALARNIFNYFNLLKFSALLWEMTNPHSAHRLTVL